MMRGTHGWAEVDRERKREIIRAIASGKATRGPVHAEIDITDRCNVACYFCNQMDVRTKQQLSLEHVTRLVDELASTGLKSVRLSGGGDPLMHTEILRVFDHLAKRNVVVDNLTTNGALLGREIAIRLVQNKAREVIFSLNAIDAADYGRMMQVRPAIFDRVTESIRQLIELRGESSYPVVVVQFLLDRKNYQSLPQMYDLGRALDADRIAIGLVLEIPNERVDPALTIRPEDGEMLRPVLEQVLLKDREARVAQIDLPYPNINAMMLEIKSQLDYKAALPLFPTAPSFKEHNGHCFFGWYTATIRGNGDMYPCCLLMTPDYKPLGNATKDSFASHWNGPVFRRLRQEMRAVFLAKDPPFDPSYFKLLKRQCVEPNLCWLKNVYFRGDEEFYRELDRALEKPRRFSSPQLLKWRWKAQKQKIRANPRFAIPLRIYRSLKRYRDGLEGP